MENIKNKAITLLCVALAAAMLATSCAPRVQTAPRDSSQDIPLSSAVEPGLTAPSEPLPEPEQDPIPEPDVPEAPIETPVQSQSAPELSGDVSAPSEPEPSEPDTPPADGTAADNGLANQDISYSLSNIDITPATVTFANSPRFDLSIPSTLMVTRPEKSITTTYANYYIMGTSDPGAPLYFDGEKLERFGSKGTWGVYVELDAGINNFTVRQGDKSVNITITRKGIQSPQPISVITQSSMYPAVQGGVKAGDVLTAQCTAPSGASVTASFGGKSVVIQQVANATAGMPATFRGDIPVGDSYPAGVTSKAGKVKYTLTYNGKTTEYTSTGDVFVAGAGSYIAVKVKAYLGLVYDDPKSPGVFREKLRTGAADYVYSEDNAYYRLYSGGYIAKEQCEIIEGEVKIGNKISAVSTSVQSDKETYTFLGAAPPAYRAYLAANGTFVLIVYNTNGAQPVDVSGSKLFSSVKATANENSSVTYVFTFKDAARYWGSLVQYDGGNLLLSFQYKPALSSGSKPLSGVSIMLDPGHGDHDPGALGFAGIYGPDENTLNLANAYATRDALENLGAKVVFTRKGLDEFLTLDERLQAFEQSGADMFISLHHNSLGESTDGNPVNGTEIYWHTGQSTPAASVIADALTAKTGRRNRGAKPGYYRVTILPSAPSMLIELGFLCNPAEYEHLTDAAVIRQAAQGIADGVVAALK